MNCIRRAFRCVPFGLLLAAQFAGPLAAQSVAVAEYKAMARKDVEAMTKRTQVMIDTVFSFGELGFQEVETSKFLTGILEQEGFRVEHGVAGIPTAWVAK